MHFGYALLFVAAAGLTACTGFLILLLVGSFRFRRREVPEISVGAYPPVTLLKPLCGMEPNLRANIASFFDQEYPSFEIIFGARDSADPALAVVEEVRRQYPAVPVQIVISGEPTEANAKVCSMRKMYAQAKHDYLVISDSDVQVKPSYVREVVAPLLDPRVGMVTCMYRGVASGGIWTRLEALGMSVEMTSGVVVSELLEGMKFALGPTMAIRRDVLEAVGGFDPLAIYCADDYVLGQRVAESGSKVELSTHVIDHVVVNQSLYSSLLHQVRWMKSTRFSRPAGHFASVLSFAMPFGLLGFVVAIALGHPTLAVACITGAFLNRVLLAVFAGWGVARDPHALRQCWLYPLRDLMGFGFWLCSFAGNTITWRGQRYRLELEGLMVPVQSTPGLAGIRYREPVITQRVESSFAAERLL
jgi:ceramide glucosyltransferase